MTKGQRKRIAVYSCVSDKRFYLGADGEYTPDVMRAKMFNSFSSANAAALEAGVSGWELTIIIETRKEAK